MTHCRSLHSYQAAFREVSRPSAASSLFDRPSCSYRRSRRQAPASQWSAVALSPDGPRSYHGRISNPEVSQLRAWNILTGDLVQLFEIRFSLWTQQHPQRFPQVTRSLLSRVPSGVLASGSCALPVSTSGTAHSLENPGRVAPGAPHGSSLARFGVSQLRWLGPFLPARVPSHFPRFCIWCFLSQFVVKSVLLFCIFFTSAWTCLFARSLLILCVIKKSMFNDMD